MMTVVNTFGVVAVTIGLFIVTWPRSAPRNHPQLQSWSHVPPPRLDRGCFTPAEEVGAKLIQRNGCVQCHSLDGTRGVGPTLRDVAGDHVVLEDGTTVFADDDYLRDSILTPHKQRVSGFGNTMPSYAGKLRDVDITVMVAYLRSISRHVTPTTAPVGVD